MQRDAYRDYNDLEDAPQIDVHENHHRWAVVRELHNLAVDTSGLNEAKRCFIGTICAYWIDHNRITKQDYVRGLGEYITLLEDIVIDVPKIHEWTVQMICKCFDSFFFRFAYKVTYGFLFLCFCFGFSTNSGASFQRYHDIK